MNLDGKDYYRMIRVWRNGSFRDTLYYRKSTDGKVYERRKTTDEILKFDFNIKSGETWNYLENYPRSYTYYAFLMSEVDTIHLGNTILSKVFRYYYDVPQLADEEHVICLAPGIGFVKEVYLGGTPDRIALKKVRINGIEREFR